MYVYRGWYLGGTVGSWFRSCKMVLPNPKPDIFQAQAKSRFATKVVSRVHIRLLQNQWALQESLQDCLKKAKWMFVVILK